MWPECLCGVWCVLYVWCVWLWCVPLCDLDNTGALWELHCTLISTSCLMRPPLLHSILHSILRHISSMQQTCTNVRMRTIFNNFFYFRLSLISSFFDIFCTLRFLWCIEVKVALISLIWFCIIELLSDITKIWQLELMVITKFAICGFRLKLSYPTDFSAVKMHHLCHQFVLQIRQLVDQIYKTPVTFIQSGESYWGAGNLS